VSLSSDGTIVAIGAKNNDGNGDSSGHVRVYQYVVSGWVKMGADIDGEGVTDFSGHSVSLSSDGSIVAIGAIENDGNGSNSGHVRLYKSEYIMVPNCFPAGTLVTTDQGNVAIDKLKPKVHTISGNEIIAITQSRTIEKYIVSIEKDALVKNVPCVTTQISNNHELLYKGKMTKACELVGLCDGITSIHYDGQTLYNVLLEKHGKMMINNLICETLHPNNIMARIITGKMSQKEQIAIYSKLNKIIRSYDLQAYNKLYASLK